MKAKYLFLISISVLVLLSLQSCNYSTQSENKETNSDSLSNQNAVQLSVAEKSNLNRFFTSFSEIYLTSFAQNNVPDSVLIQFGLYYNYQRHFKSFKQIQAGLKTSIPEAFVSDTSYQYFGVKIKKHQSFQDIEYTKNTYLINNADGEAYRFSQTKELIELGDGIFEAKIDVFIASSGFTGDVNANPETWKTSDSEDIPQLEGSMKAKIRKVDEKGMIRYVLLEYLKL